jgi:hypothetical protein
MNIVDIKLDPITHDLFLQDGDLVLIYGLDLVTQNLKIRLWVLFGEWFLDYTQGIRFLQDIMTKKPDESSVAAQIKSCILDTDNVTKLTSFSITTNPAVRTALVTFSVETIYGTISDLTLGSP